MSLMMVVLYVMGHMMFVVPGENNRWATYSALGIAKRQNPTESGLGNTALATGLYRTVGSKWMVGGSAALILENIWTIPTMFGPSAIYFDNRKRSGLFLKTTQGLAYRYKDWKLYNLEPGWGMAYSVGWGMPVGKSSTALVQFNASGRKFNHRPNHYHLEILLTMLGFR